MKVVQTSLNEAEYALLDQYARRSSKSIKEVTRDAIRKLVADEGIFTDDPLLAGKPLSPATGKRERTSAEHDKALYGDSV